MLLFALLLGGMWIAQSLSFVASGQVPQVISDAGHQTSVVFALDLSLLVPGLVVAAVLLWQRRPWGYVLAAILLIKAVTYALALIAMAVFSASQTGIWEPLVLLWVVLGVGCLIAAYFLLGNMQPTEKQPLTETPTKVGTVAKASASTSR
jgi:hypothetical protein